MARCIGIDLDQMEGFGNPSHKALLEIYRNTVPELLLCQYEDMVNRQPMPWSQVQDPLAILLSHSDCEGSISHEVANAIASRLHDILPLLPTKHKEVTIRFINGLRDAANKQEDVGFH